MMRHSTRGSVPPRTGCSASQVDTAGKPAGCGGSGECSIPNSVITRVVATRPISGRKGRASFRPRWVVAVALGITRLWSRLVHRARDAYGNAVADPRCEAGGGDGSASAGGARHFWLRRRPYSGGHDPRSESVADRGDEERRPQRQLFGRRDRGPGRPERDAGGQRRPHAVERGDPRFGVRPRRPLQRRLPQAFAPRPTRSSRRSRKRPAPPKARPPIDPPDVVVSAPATGACAESPASALPPPLGRTARCCWPFQLTWWRRCGRGKAPRPARHGSGRTSTAGVAPVD